MYKRQGQRAEDDEGDEGRAHADEQGATEHAAEDLEVIEQASDLDVADQLAVVEDGNRQHAQLGIVVADDAVGFGRAQALRVEQTIIIDEIVRPGDDFAQMCIRDRGQRLSVEVERHAASKANA